MPFSHRHIQLKPTQVHRRVNFALRAAGFYPGFFTDDIFWPPLSDEREMHGATHSDKSESILFRRGNTLAHHVRFEASKMVNIIY
jgi:hypothetical protein